MDMALSKSRLIIIIFVVISVLSAGWIAGINYGYRSGYSAAEKLHHETILTKKNIPLHPDTEKIMRAARGVRNNLLIQYKAVPLRDFVTLLSAHLKGSSEICQAYFEFETLSPSYDVFKTLCSKDILPFVKAKRNFLYDQQQKMGLGK